MGIKIKGGSNYDNYVVRGYRFDDEEYLKIGGSFCYYRFADFKKDKEFYIFLAKKEDKDRFVKLLERELSQLGKSKFYHTLMQGWKISSTDDGLVVSINSTSKKSKRICQGILELFLL